MHEGSLLQNVHLRIQNAVHIFYKASTVKQNNNNKYEYNENVLIMTTFETKICVIC